MTVPIPSPPAVPFLGHINAIDKNVPTKSLSLLAQQYGEIYQLSILGMYSYVFLNTSQSLTKNIGNKIVFVNSHALVNEVSDDKRFPKMVSAGLRELRNGAGDGLFTVRPIVDFA